MAKEQKETESEIISETDKTAAAPLENKEKGLVSEPIKKLSLSNLINEFESEQLKKQLPEIYVGDTVKVGVKITDCLLYTSPSPRDS